MNKLLTRISSVSFLRVSLGIILLLNHISDLCSFNFVFSEQGIINYLNPIFGIKAIYFTYLNLFFYIFSILLIVLFILGRKTSFVSISLFLLNIYYIQLGLGVFHSGWVTTINYFVLLVGISSYISNRSYFLLLICQIIFIYFKTSFHRINDPRWLDGQMGFSIINSIFSRWSGIDWLEYSQILKIVTYIILILEISSPILLIFKKTRRYLIYFLLAFHIGVELTMHVGYWSWLMICLLMSLKLEDNALSNKTFKMATQSN
ncbi:MAG: hypothetical protein H6625_05795 [Bdellovibrionaceae bacterium]|nr:hypothetical protein [Pseudobdellovibrionaceae bacterium]